MHRAHHGRRTTAGVAALLPALLLAALYVAAPFAGTTTHAISHRTSLRDTAAAAGQQAASGSTATRPPHRRQATSPATRDSQRQGRVMNAPVHLSIGSSTTWTLILWYGGAVLVALAVIGWLAARVGAFDGVLDRN